jgi:glycerol-3-phosphate dehydrogenase
VSASAGRVITVTGGKLTTYRRMAADTVDDVMAVLERPGRSRTRSLALVGADGYAEPADGADAAAHLSGRYGGEAPAVEALFDEDGALARPLVPGLPYLGAEALFAARHEMATTLDDVLSRRTRARLLARDASVAAAPAVARLLAREMGWDDAECERQAHAYAADVAYERATAGLGTALDAMLGA